jgi:DNA-binding SARP family transcriptional activator
MALMSLASREVRREALLARLERVRPRILALIAPAGYGKSTLARQLLSGRDGAAICDAAGVLDELDLARRVVPALAVESPSRTQALTQRELMLGDGGTSVADRVHLALEAWQQSVSGTTFVFEGAEHIARNAGARELFARFLTHCPDGRSIVICSREGLRVHLTRFAPPHEILTLRADDLAFDGEELARLFGDQAHDGELIERVQGLSRGWPIAVFLLKRFATEGRIGKLLESLNHVAFEELHDYLADQILASLPQPLVEALFVCACIPAAKADDLQAALGSDENVRALTEFARESPFLERTADGSFVVHPLLATLLLERYEDRRRGVLLTAAEAHTRAKEYQRAAELHLARGDHPAAAHALGQHEVIRDHTPSMEYARVLASLEHTLVQRFPRLWGVTAMLRIFCADTEELLDEAESIWRTLPPNTTSIERYYVLLFRVLFMSHIGLYEDALQIVERFCAENGVGDEPKNHFEGCLYYLLGLMRARSGEIDLAERYLTLALPHIGGTDVMSSGTFLALGAEISRVRGEFTLARQFVDRAIDTARHSGLMNYVALSMAEGAFGAWISGDEMTFERYALQLDEAVQRNGVRGLAYFAASARGRNEEPQDVDQLKWVACGRLIAAAEAPQKQQSLRHARAALAAARQFGTPFLECLALVAVAVFDDMHFDVHMAEALECAKRCSSPLLVSAVEAVAKRRGDQGMLNGYMLRLQRQQIDRVPVLEIGLTDGTVRCAGRAVTLSEREFALLVALCLRREPTPRGVLADLLWPDVDEYAARNALSVTLHRLRKSLGCEDGIVRSKDGYALNDDVRVDIWEIDRTLAALRARRELSEAERGLLEGMYAKLRGGRPDRMMNWEWFGPTERRIAELRLDVAHRLANDAVAGGDPNRALEYARDMIQYDPCDEAARRIAITAHLSKGDRSAAMRQYRQYRDRLLAELQCEPSDEIKRLVGAP